MDFRDFLDQIDRQADPGLTVHVICDNLSTHKAPAVQRWLQSSGSSLTAVCQLCGS